MLTDPTALDTRQRLLKEARRAFAERGFSEASTRQISKAAKTQVGLIAYYFGDKAGLYREILVEPLAAMMEALPIPDDEVPLEAWLRNYYRAFLDPLVGSDPEPKQLMRIFGREISEPTPVFEQAYSDYLIPQHRALAAMLARRVGANSADAQIHQLALAIAALVRDYWVSGDHIEVLAPGLLKDAEAFNRALDRLVAYASALVGIESSLRRGLGELCNLKDFPD